MRSLHSKDIVCEADIVHAQRGFRPALQGLDIVPLLCLDDCFPIIGKPSAMLATHVFLLCPANFPNECKEIFLTPHWERYPASPDDICTAGADDILPAARRYPHFVRTWTHIATRSAVTCSALPRATPSAKPNSSAAPGPRPVTSSPSVTAGSATTSAADFKSPSTPG